MNMYKTETLRGRRASTPTQKDEEGQHSLDLLKRKLSGTKADAEVSTTSCSPEDRTEHFVLSHTECDSVGSLSATFLDEEAGARTDFCLPCFLSLASDVTNPSSSVLAG